MEEQVGLVEGIQNHVVLPWTLAHTALAQGYGAAEDLFALRGEELECMVQAVQMKPGP